MCTVDPQRQLGIFGEPVWGVCVGEGEDAFSFQGRLLLIPKHETPNPKHETRRQIVRLFGCGVLLQTLPCGGNPRVAAGFTHYSQNGMLGHPGVELRANLKLISHRCHLFEMALVRDLTKETIHLPLGCLQGGVRYNVSTLVRERAKRVHHIGEPKHTHVVTDWGWRLLTPKTSTLDPKP